MLVPILVSRTWILDSNRYWDAGFLELDSGFHKKNFTRFWNKDSLTWRKTAVLSCTKNIPSPDEFTPNVIQTRTTTVGLT